ncbi:NFACT family protein [Candidatus Bipolaricaulota bacterium]|nr:NFACT family protein [Candidatus Bipolaricaulota bacterium]
MDGLSIAASLAEIAPRIADGTIRTIYQPDKGQFVLRLFAGEDVRLVIDLSEASVRTTKRDIENPAKPSVFVMLLRKHLRGGRIIALSQFGWDRVIALDILRRDGAERFSYQLIAELVGTRGNLHLIKEGKLVKSLRSDRRNSIGRSYVGLPPQDKCDPSQVARTQLEGWFAEGSPAEALARRVDGIGRQTAADLVSESTGDDLALELSVRLKALLTFVRSPQAYVTEDQSRATFYPLPPPAIQADGFQEALDRVKVGVRQENLPPQDALLRDLKRAVRARERTIEKLLDWLEDSSQADAWQSQADLLMTFQSDIPPGDDSVTLTNPIDESTVTIALDPSLSAIENAQSLYKRAKRIRRGHPHVHIRLKRLRRELGLLQRSLDARQRDEAVESEILEMLPNRKKKAPLPKKALPFRQFEVDGFHIWLGKSARQNDALLRAASPNDIWMHAKDYAGSHVVIRARGQERIPDAVLQSAGRLAALHSKAKSERRVEITMTQVKKVRKPKGAPAGLVNVRDTDTLTVELPEGEA